MTDPTQPAALTASEATTGRSVLAGGAWNTVALVLPQIYTLLISVAVARFLGPHNMGRQSFIAFVQLSLFLVLANGMPSALQRFTGELLGRNRPDAVRRVLRWAIVSQLVSAVVALAVLTLIGLTRTDLQGAWLFAGVACAAGVLHAVPSSALMGLQRFRESSVIGLLTGAVGVIGTVVVLGAGWGIAGIFGLEAIIGIVNATATAMLARRALSGITARASDEPLPPELPRSVTRYALVQTFQTLIYFVVWRRSEFFFLERWSSDSELAMYSVAFAATTALVRLPQGASGVLLPAIATLHGAREIDRIRRAFERSVRLLLVFSLPLTAGALALGPVAVRVVYGHDYERAGVVLIVLLTIFPLLPLFNICTAVLQGIDRLGLVVGANLIATAVNIGADVLLIGRHGAVGAAFANVAAQGLAAVLLVAMTVRVVGARRADSWRLVRNVVAATIAGGAAFAMSAWLPDLLALVAGSALFAVVWPAAAVAVRVIGADDARWLSESLGSRVGGAATRCLRPFLR